MKTVNQKIRFSILALLLSVFAVAQTEGVSIKTTPSAPHASAMLDVESSTKGMLVPRVPLTNTLTSPLPIGTTPADGLLVYNITTTTNVTPGFYYWSTTLASWVKIGSELWSPDPATTSTTGIIRSGGTVTVGSYTTTGGYSLVETTTLNVRGPAVFASCCATAATSGIHIGEKTDLSPFADGHWNEINTYDANLEFQRKSGKNVEIGSVGGANLYVNSGGVSGKGEIHAEGDMWMNAVHYTSDSLQKKNFSSCTNVLSRLNSFNTYYYNFKSESNEDTKHIGVIAQQVQREFPELVRTSERTIITNKFSDSPITTTTTKLGVEYSSLTALLLQAIKEQQALISDLQSRVADLENK